MLGSPTNPAAQVITLPLRLLAAVGQEQFDRQVLEIALQASVLAGHLAKHEKSWPKMGIL